MAAMGCAEEHFQPAGTCWARGGVQDPPCSSTGTLQWFSPSLLSRCIFTAEAGAGAGMGAQCPPKGTARPCTPAQRDRMLQQSWLCSQTAFSKGQPNLWLGRGRERQLGAPAPAVAVPSCPKSRSSEGSRGWAQQWDAHSSCGVPPKARMVGHAQGFQTQLSLPTQLQEQREDWCWSTRSSENDSVLLRPLPPQAAVQGAKAAVLLLLLFSQLHKHLQNMEETPCSL